MVNLSEEKKTQLILEPYTYICQNPGKAIRIKLTEAFNLWLNIPEDKLKVVYTVMEMLHNASLLIDDVQDNSELRRGKPVAHLIYGTPITINSANYVYFLALEEVLKLNNPKLVQIFSEELQNLHRGQGMELHCRERNLCPTQDEYLKMVSEKTGGLLRLGIKMMQELSDSDKDCVHIVDLIGRLYQIRDDYINLKASDYQTLKGFCEDLTEGKYSFLVIHALGHSKDSHQLEYILKQRTLDVELKRHALRIMEDAGSFEYARQYLIELEATVRQEINKLEDNPFLIKILDILKKDFV